MTFAKYTGLIVAGVIAFSAPDGFGQDTAAPGGRLFPPVEIISRLLDTHPMVREAGAKLNAAEADARRLRVGDHDFVLEGEYVRRDVSPGPVFNEWNAGVSRAIRLPGKASADRKIGDIGIRAAELARDDARHQTALLFKDQWIAWTEASAQLSIDEAEADTYRKEVDNVQRRLDLKGASQLDLEQARAALAQAESAEIESRRVLDGAALTLHHSFPDLVLPSKVPSFPEPTGLPGGEAEWRMRVIEHSHEIALAAAQAQRAMSIAHRASMDRFADPTIGVRAFQERGGEETGIGVSLSIPFGLRRRQAISDTMRADAVAASVREQAMRREIALVADKDVSDAVASFNAWKKAALARKASSDVVSRMRRAVQLGDRDFSELLLVLRQHFNVERSEEKQRAAAHRALFQLEIDAHQIWGLHHEDE